MSTSIGTGPSGAPLSTAPQSTFDQTVGKFEVRPSVSNVRVFKARLQGAKAPRARLHSSLGGRALRG